MPRKPSWPPPIYIRHGIEYARVYHDGKPKEYRLGPAGSVEARAAYARLQAELLAGVDANSHGPAPAEPAASLTVSGLLLAWESGRAPRYAGTQEAGHYRQALGVVTRLCGGLPAERFGPVQLLGVRDEFRRLGWCRRHCNRQLTRVKTAWRWLESQGLVPAGAWHALLSVRGLEYGEAPDRGEVLPVPEADLVATLPRLNRVVRAAVEVQLLTAARPSEVLGLRPCDIHRDAGHPLVGGVVLPVGVGGCWVAVLGRHKTAHRGHKRVLFIGPQAQAVLAPFLGRAPDAYLFSPREAAPDRRGGKGPAGERYRVDSFDRAIARACGRAGVAPWAPNRLRHNAATRLVQQFGWEVARLVLGHRSTEVTRVYALPDLRKAAEAMGEAG